ncbi:unnamed protein product [Durusdinium trenchii]|uniref:Uncharacterized protein n=1 Tax=Durusdinium trenchii TaxID=1381693 RepID=A0ABP0P9I6_9DINO
MEMQSESDEDARPGRGKILQRHKREIKALQEQKKRSKQATRRHLFTELQLRITSHTVYSATHDDIASFFQVL